MDRNRIGNVAVDTNRIIPIWEKYLLTIEEAALYFHIGEKRLREIYTGHSNSELFVQNGNRVLVKRKLFELHIDEIEVV